MGGGGQPPSIGVRQVTSCPGLPLGGLAGTRGYPLCSCLLLMEAVSVQGLDQDKIERENQAICHQGGDTVDWHSQWGMTGVGGELLTHQTSSVKL